MPDSDEVPTARRRDPEPVAKRLDLKDADVVSAVLALVNGNGRPGLPSSAVGHLSSPAVGSVHRVTQDEIEPAFIAIADDRVAHDSP